MAESTPEYNLAVIVDGSRSQADQAILDSAPVRDSSLSLGDLLIPSGALTPTQQETSRQSGPPATPSAPSSTPPPGRSFTWPCTCDRDADDAKRLQFTIVHLSYLEIRTYLVSTVFDCVHGGLSLS